MVDLRELKHRAGVVQTRTSQRREAVSAEEGAKATLLELIAAKLKHHLVRLDYNPDQRLEGNGTKTQYEYPDGRWNFPTLGSPNPPEFAFVIGCDSDEINGPYLEVIALRFEKQLRFSAWRIFIGGIVGLEIVDARALQSQPG